MTYKDNDSQSLKEIIDTYKDLLKDVFNWIYGLIPDDKSIK
ncbi:hypothetical protein [Confluentibacter sediminis]|nr:hypothetical protein [Confluentibacter sediminis]